jgi:pSer/pThr/pTyr-binding forkhead associated (FHA) protein
MPFIILGRARFALPVGETPIGGAGANALPFPELAGHATMATLRLTPDGAVRVWPLRERSALVTVNGAPLGARPVTLTHGAKIQAAGITLVFGELRELRTATEVLAIRDLQSAPAGGNTAAQATAASGGQVVACATGVLATIPDIGLVIGRGPDSDLVILGRDVSRRHAVIRASAQGYMLRDVSTNGTFVNGRRVNGTQILGMGDMIRIGSEELRFEAHPAAPQSAAEPPRTEVSPPTAPAPPHSPLLEPPTGPRSAASSSQRQGS